ncbi:type II secretion system protein GspK, partial [Methylobacterium sp. Leaf118]|uniref:type II secretion system protein GspK n=1 Tax=Methylobacterium sp. Leaf118 TaxID=2876562 RepID=UPI001E56C75E
MTTRPTAPGRGGRHRRAGFILVAVLGVVALLASLMGGSTLLVRAAFEGAQAKSDDLALEGLLRAGLDLAAHELYGLRLPPGLIEGQEIRLDSGTVTLSVSDEAGRIDLNGADPALIAAAYRAVGGRGLHPEAFAARVVAWRQRHEPTGKTPQIDENQRPPRREGFRTVGELRWLTGVTAADAAALAGLLTVHNPGGRIDPESAPPSVLLALPGMRPPVVDQVLALRRRPGARAHIAALLRPQAAFLAAKGGAA